MKFPDPLFYFYVNMDSKKIYHRFFRNSADKLNEEETEHHGAGEKSPPKRSSLMALEAYRTEKNKEIKREGFDVVEKKVARIGRFIKRMYA